MDMATTKLDIITPIHLTQQIISHIIIMKVKKALKMDMTRILEKKKLFIRKQKQKYWMQSNCRLTAHLGSPHSMHLLHIDIIIIITIIIIVIKQTIVIIIVVIMQFHHCNHRHHQAPHLGSATLQTRGKMMAMTVDNILSGQTIKK